MSVLPGSAAADLEMPGVLRVGGKPWGRRLAGDFVVYGLGGSGAKVINAFLLPVFTRILTPGDLGVIDLLTSVASIVMVMGGLGIEAALVYFYARYDDPAGRRAFASTAVAFALVGTLVASSVALLGDPLLRAILGSDTYSAAYYLTLAMVPVSLTAGLVMDILRLEFRSRAFAVVSFGRTIGTAALAIAVIVITDTGVAGYVASQIAVSVVSIAACLFLIRGSLGTKPDLAILRRLLRFGLPLVPLGMTAWVLAWSDRVFLASFGYVHDLGYYAVANRLSQLTFLAVLALQAAWAPFAITAARDPAHRPVFVAVFRIVAFGLLALVVLTSVVAGPIVALVLPMDYSAAIQVVPFLAAAVAVQGLGGLIAIGLLLTERTGRLALIGGVTAVCNVIFNVVAIPPLGILGAGVATLGSSFVGIVLVYAAAERAYPIGYPGRGFIVAAGIIGIGLATLVLPESGRGAMDGGAPAFALRMAGVAVLTAAAGLALGVHPFVMRALAAAAERALGPDRRHV